jgi:hypothetical protein
MMMQKSELIFFDFNFYINLFRFSNYEKKMERFFQGAYCYAISKIVLMEPWAWAQTKFEEALLKQHERSFPMLLFSDDNFIRAGRLMQKMEKDHSFELCKSRRLTWIF